MADGKWVMTEEDARRVDLTFDRKDNKDMRALPNYGQHRAVDDRSGNGSGRTDPDTGRTCAFCGSDDLQSGFGGCGEGFGYRSFLCRDCGGTTDFVYKDDIGKYFR